MERIAKIGSSVAALAVTGATLFGVGRVTSNPNESATPTPTVTATGKLEPTATPIAVRTVVSTVTPKSPEASTTATATPIPNCEVNLLLLGFRYIDNPVTTNREGHIDPADYIIGKRLKAGSARISRVVVNPTDKSSSLSYIDTVQMESHGDYASALKSIKTVANLSNGSAVKLSVAFENDKPQVEDPFIANCGKDRLYIGGRYATESEINSESKNSSGIDLVGARAEMITKELFKGRSPKLIDQPNTPIQNKADLTANIKVVIEQMKKARSREQQAAKKAGIE